MMPLVLALALPALGADTCVKCHSTLEDKHAAILKSFARDIHAEKGLSCADCHGGDRTREDMGEAMDPAKGFVGVPSPAQAPQFCGKCHSDPARMKKWSPSLPTDQVAKYYTSVHGRRLKAGDAKVASCASCHPAHSIRPAKDPTSSVYVKNIPETCGRCHSDAARMKPYGIPTDQAAKYAASVHGKALFERGDSAAPVCTSCHGTHGAAPPGVAGIGQVCGSCHAGNMDLFKGSPMAKAWDERHLHMCATCHGHHLVEKPTSELLSGGHAVCLRCHQAGSKPLAVAASMKASIDGVEGAYKAAEAAIAEAEVKGMDMGDARDALDGARQAMYQSRTAVHSFSAEKVGGTAAAGTVVAEKARKEALAAVEDFRLRRVGLGVATLVISLLAGALYLKIREIESE